jgi:hypothetical protein
MESDKIVSQSIFGKLHEQGLLAFAEDDEIDLDDDEIDEKDHNVHDNWGSGGIDDEIHFVPAFKANAPKEKTIVSELEQIPVDGFGEGSDGYNKLSQGSQKLIRFCEMCNKYYSPNMVAKWSSFTQNGVPESDYVGTCYHCFFFHHASQGTMKDVVNKEGYMSLVGFIIQCLQYHKCEECHVTMFGGNCPICAFKLGCLPEGLSDDDMSLLIDANASQDSATMDTFHADDVGNSQYNSYLIDACDTVFDIEL